MIPERRVDVELRETEISHLLLEIIRLNRHVRVLWH